MNEIDGNASNNLALADVGSSTMLDSGPTDPYLSTFSTENERRASQGSFGSEFEDFEDDVCEAEVEVLARLGHDLEAVNVFESEGAIDFGEDED